MHCYAPDHVLTVYVRVVCPTMWLLRHLALIHRLPCVSSRASVRTPFPVPPSFTHVLNVRYVRTYSSTVLVPYYFYSTSKSHCCTNAAVLFVPPPSSHPPSPPLFYPPSSPSSPLSLPPLPRVRTSPSSSDYVLPHLAPIHIQRCSIASLYVRTHCMHYVVYCLRRTVLAA